MTLRLTRIDMLAYPVDDGRRGQLHNGFCQSGPLDPYAFTVANLLCGQDSGSALEFIGAIECEFTQTCVVSVTGPAVEITVQGELQPAWQAITVKAGQSLLIHPARMGSKHYLAIQGGFQFPKVLNSSCMVRREKTGGLNNDGQPLRVGDCLQLASQLNLPLPALLPAHLKPDYSSDCHVGIVPGYQHDWLTNLEWQRLLGNEYTLTAQADRMGYRLLGAAIQVPKRSLYSEAIALGAMQIPPDGQPIVMMADRQTLGGYPKVGSIARCDLNHFAQCTAGDKISFYQLNADDARARWLLKLAAIKRWLSE